MRRLVHDVIDEHGNRCRQSRSLVDGAMVDGDDDASGADAAFERLEGYLAAIGVDEAAEVLFIADGARWIWNRARPMLDRLGVDGDAVSEAVDWYHAKEAVYELADQPARWSDSLRCSWRNKVVDRLYDGRIDQVVELIEELAEADDARDASDKCTYFKRNRQRMNYRGLADQNLPTGSGAVESAVRRVVNQRIKANGKFWDRDNVETMLFWRGYLKTDHLDDLCSWSRRFRARWWMDSTQCPAQKALSAA